MWGAIASAAGQAGGGIYGISEARRNARNQRDWTLEMSQTAHQREVKDLRAAGLNPILSSGGPGASVGPGATAVTPDLAQAVGGAATSAREAMITKQRVRESKAQATSAETQAAIDKDTLQFYKDNPQLQGTAQAANLADKTGASANAAALSKAGFSINSAYRKHVKEPTEKMVDKLMKSGVKRRYEKANRKTREGINKAKSRKTLKPGDRGYVPIHWKHHNN